MKYFLVMAAVYTNFALAESVASVSSLFQPMPNAPLTFCGGSVRDVLKCSEPKLKGEITWTNASLSDWAGSIMRVQLKFVSNTAGSLTGVVKFSYIPDGKLVAIAIKQSAGAEDLTVSGALNDFTDVEGRRIVSFEPGHAIEIQLRINVPYVATGQILAREFMVEVEPIEYLQ